MKIVITYDIGDDCTWCAQNTDCFEYESVEAAYSDFVDACRKQYAIIAEHHSKTKNMDFAEKIKIPLPTSEISIFNAKYDINLFFSKGYDNNVYEHFPEFFELNDWFEKNKMKEQT